MTIDFDYPGSEHFSKSSMVAWALIVVVIYFLYRMFNGNPILSYGNLQSVRNPRGEGEYATQFPYINVYAHEPGTNEWVQAANATFIPRMGHPNGQEYIPTQPYIVQDRDYPNQSGPEPPDKTGSTTQNWYQFLNNFYRSQGTAWVKKRMHPGNAA